MTPAPMSSSLLSGAAPPAAVCAERGPQVFYSAEAFVDTWISAHARPEPTARDFTFKAVIGECPW